MFKVIILVAAFSAAVTSLPIDNEDTSIEKPGYCHYKGIYIKDGEWSPGPLGECTKFKCQIHKSGEISISGLTCPAFVPSVGCYESEYDYTKRYPDCCSESVCPEGYNNSHVLTLDVNV